MTFLIAVNVKKAVYADRQYLRGTALYSKNWTPAMDDRLRGLCNETHLTDIAVRMGVRVDSLRNRVALLGLTPLSYAVSVTPTRGEWVGAVNRIATEAGISPVGVLAGQSHRGACVVRWRAWAALLDEYPQYTVAGVARASGHDHTSALHALEKMGWKRKLSTGQPAE